MQSRFARAVAGVAALAMLASCATPPAPGTALSADQRQQAQRDCVIKYTALGAVSGAALTAIFGGNRNQALAGAAVGGVLSAAIAWGQCFSYYSDLRSFPVADAQTTRRDTGWVPARGNEVRLSSFRAAPLQAQSGGKVDLDASYYVMAPGEMTEVKVIETRSVSYFDPAQNNWRDLGSVDQTVTASLGTRRAQGSFDLPADVPPGRYRIGLSVNALGKTDTATQEINVTKA